MEEGTYRIEPHLQIQHRFQDLPHIYPSNSIRYPRLPNRPRLGNLLLIQAQKPRLVRPIRDEEPRYGGHSNGRETLDQEKDPPASDRLVLIARDPVGEGARECGGEGRGGGEETDSEADFVSEVEEREEIDDSGAMYEVS